jgi:hypothetical protein
MRTIVKTVKNGKTAKGSHGARIIDVIAASEDIEKEPQLSFLNRFACGQFSATSSFLFYVVTWHVS